MNAQRFRLRHTFWLDLNKNDERLLADQIAILKESRTFVKTIRDGIRLISDLRAGRIDVLLELFPFVKVALPGSNSGGNDDEIRALRAMLEQHIITSARGTAYRMAGVQDLLKTPDLPPMQLAFAGAIGNPMESRASFAGGLGNLFSDDSDDEELWN